MQIVNAYAIMLLELGATPGIIGMTAESSAMQA